MVAILLSQLVRGPTDVFSSPSGEAGVVDARHEVWHVVRMRWSGVGGSGERSNKELRWPARPAWKL